MIKSVLIDLDDTLLDFQRGEIEAITDILKEQHVKDIPNGIKTYLNVNQETWRKIEKGGDVKKLLNNRFTETFSKLGRTVNGEDLNHEYLNHISNNFYLVPGAKKLLKKLKQMNLNIVAVTNGIKRNQIKRLNGAGIINNFDLIWISEDVGIAKPDAQFFKKLFDKHPKINPATSIVIGDGISSDILGANNANIPSIWYLNNATSFPNNAKPNYIVTKLDQIPELISKINEK